MIRTHWSDKMFTRKGYYQLDRNENCDSLMSQNSDLFCATLIPSIIIQYPNLMKAYESLSSFGLDPNSTLLTHGAEGAIRAVINFHRNLASISYPYPTYGMIPVFAEMYGMRSITAKYDDNFRFDIETLLQGDIIYLANPDNPTGSVVGVDVIAQLCESRRIVIIDETYHGFSDISALEMISSYDNLYIIRSFSKAQGAAGVRLGAIISSPSNIAHLRDEKPAYEISSIACEYLSFMSRKTDVISLSLDRIKKGKRVIEEELSSNGFKCIDTHANFTLVEFDNDLYERISSGADVAIITINDKKYIRITAPDVDTASMLINAGLFQRSEAEWEKNIPIEDIQHTLTSIGISLVDRCNRKCEMCPHGHGYVSMNGDMTLETATVLAKELRSMPFKGRVVLAGFGEPMLHKDIDGIVSIISSYLDPMCGLDLVTNGDFLTPERIKSLLSSGVKKIIVSMHDGEHQVEHFKKMFADAGSSAFTLREHWNKECSSFTNRCGYVSDVPNEPLNRTCHYPFYHIEIRPNGDVVMCSQNWNKSIDAYNIHEWTLKDIWTSPWISAYRKSLVCADRSLSPCNKCNVKGDVYGARPFKMWKEYLKMEGMNNGQ